MLYSIELKIPLITFIYASYILNVVMWVRYVLEV
jgi:hypothetical protein